MADAVSTWAGTHTFGAARVVAARSAEEAADAVRTFPGSVRALGTRHSFNDIADTDGTLISLTPAGRELIDRVSDAHLANEARLLASLTAAERKQLATLLRKLRLGLPDG